jgi:hypothetical protein
MAGFQGVTDGTVTSVGSGERGAAGQAAVVTAGQLLGGGEIARQGGEETFRPFRRKPQLGRELPQDGAELRAQAEHALGEEVGQRGGAAPELEHVGDVAAGFDGKDELGTDLRAPIGEAVR